MQKRYLTVVAVMLLATLTARAQETEKDEELNAFGYPDKSFVAMIEANQNNREVKVNPKPSCDDATLAKMAQAAIRPYVAEAQQTIYKKRRSALILKNIDSFVELEAESILPEDHPKAAGRIVELKINNRLDDENIKVCQSKNPELEAKLYLVLYDDNDDVRVDVVNFSDKEVPSFIYTKD